MRLKLPQLVRRSLKATSFWRDYSLILGEFKYFPWIAFGAIAFAFGAALFEGFGFGFLLTFLQSLVSPDAAPFHTGHDWFDVWILGVNESATSRLFRVSGLILISTWIRAVFNYLSQVFTELTQHKLVDSLRRRIFEQLQSLSLSYFTKAKSGELVSTLTNEIGSLRAAFGALSYIVTKGLTLIVYLFLLFTISWQLTIISVMLFSLVAAGLKNLNARVREASFGIPAASGRFTSVSMEIISGIRTVQAFATQDYERQRFYRASSDLLDVSMKAVKRWALIRPLAEGLASTVLISMIIVALTVFVANGMLQTASLLTFLFILFRLVPAIHELNGNVAVLNNFTGALDNIQQLLRTDNKPYLSQWYATLSRAATGDFL
ncbi:ABC transporter transmembrane domain-containing protein [Kovacikia minuta]|uniref:ABC transporter transmembrane domain-containing protein n=1 Tax=Kovacikia minuta TaxID=2931930 RepID=UPI0020C79C6A|nr:ABC transporter transmembrane domain-containing protein [Kovacikia minuta]